MENFWQMLREKRPELTRSGRLVADYLLQNPQGAQNLSISQLAQVCQVAEATIFRFCRALGFEGYHEMKIAIAQAMLCSLSKRVANFSPCQADRTNGGGTQADLRTLQTLAGIPVTGALDRLTWEYLTRLYHLFITRNVRLQLEKS